MTSNQFGSKFCKQLIYAAKMHVMKTAVMVPAMPVPTMPVPANAVLGRLSQEDARLPLPPGFAGGAGGHSNVQWPVSGLAGTTKRL